MSSKFEKLKKMFANDPDMLAVIERKEALNELKGFADDMKDKTVAEIAKLIQKGDKGDTPIKGKDYFTDEEVSKVAEYIKHTVKKEVTPIKGKDYFDGDKGKDADEDYIIREVKKIIPTVEEIASKVKMPQMKEVDTGFIINRVLNSIPKPIIPTVEEIVKEIKSKRLIELRDIKGARLDNPKGGYSMNDQRWHGGGIGDISGLITAGTNISITGLGTIASPYVINSMGIASGVTSINSDVTAAQTLAVGTAGTDFAIVDNGTGTHTFNLPTASALNRGALSSTDWSTFNSKQNAITPGALTKTDDTNVTLTLGGTPATSLLQAVSLTLGWSGQLSLARGGTGANLSDPGANTLMGWDDTDNSVAFFAIGTNLSYDHATHTLSATGGASGATTALDNLASVAINTTLVSDTDNTDALGTAAISWSDLFLGNGSVITWSSAPNTADLTLTHSANVLTLAGGDLKLSAQGNVANSALTTDATQTLTNKTLNSNTNYIDADATHQKIFLNLGRAGVVGDAVYVSAWNIANNCVEVSLARANSTTTLPCAGVLESAGADGTVQSMRVEGILTGVDTSAWSAGTRLYVSASTAGALTSTRPTTPNFDQAIATVSFQNAAGILDVIRTAYVGTMAYADTATYATLTSPTFQTSINGAYLTASEILITDGSKNIVSAPVATYPSLTELSYIKGLTSAVQSQLNGKAATLSGIINEIAYFSSASTIASLAVATYPSLTELSYVKGVTSSIQTQLNAKGVGDMTLAGIQSVTGLKTFDTTKLAIKGSSTGTTAIASANASATGYTATLPAKDITIAGTIDIPVKATGAELDTGTDDAKFATAKALKDSHNVPSVVPGTAGNVLTSDGTDWTSAAAPGGTSPIVRSYTANTRLGSSTTQFDITNPSGTTFRYTYDGTGTSPNFSAANNPIGSVIVFQAQNLNAGNKGIFVVTGSGANYVEVTNASGVAEVNKTIGTGFVIVGGVWTKPAGLKYIVVEVQAGGGAGGGSTTSGSSAGGGGGGGFTRKLILAAALAATVPYCAGDGGLGVTNTTGLIGAHSYFGTTLYATGGNGGLDYSAASFTGVAGGLGVGGDINVGGGYGGTPKTNNISNGNTGEGGIGGSSFFGGGGAGGGGNSSANGANGALYGGGGGGGQSSNAADVAGGNGANGIIILTEYY